MVHFDDWHRVSRSVGVSESLLTGTMKDGRQIGVWACGRVVRKALYWKSVE
jgi:hypothetical protein